MQLLNIQAENPQINPAWFTSQNTGLYGCLRRNLSGVISKLGIGVECEAEDLLHNGMIAKSNPFVYFGRMRSTLILSGACTPGDAASDFLLLRWLTGKATTVSQKLGRQAEMRGQVQRETQPSDPKDRSFELLLLSDPKFCATLADLVWARALELSPVSHKTMRAWSDGLRQGGVLAGAALALKAGYIQKGAPRNGAALVKVRKDLTRVLPDIMQTLLTNLNLQRYGLRLAALGVDLGDLTLSDLLSDSKTFGKFNYAHASRYVRKGPSRYSPVLHFG